MKVHGRQAYHKEVVEHVRVDPDRGKNVNKEEVRQWLMMRVRLGEEGHKLDKVQIDGHQHETKSHDSNTHLGTIADTMCV